MNLLGKVFNKILGDAAAIETRLGIPSRDGAEAERRAQRMFMMTGGRGFRVYPNEPRVYADGKTRGQKKRAARAVALAKEVERQQAEADKLIDYGISKVEAYARFGSLS
ncbi:MULTISPECIES: hypothetical protein [unclassified Mesorhizobium]|uniref:hypothetical protein n=1 Tax=unclassified Mesorhizobium TaxID=325217 RepID=UPI000FD8BE74|nr:MULTISPECIES: hypothetical protein [unclassified Mesorhizobium]TGT76190.1 hypothetical protein EN809_000770 [Mesorhizobium sp. M2E.F.Ca.ET.166.01.1.1]TGW02305.1 hypothetical protein EN797_000770 [Mesorhizobium sp. M2E.F.Ca.ET.154.01.1.1]